ncbi:MAG TPA: phosphodiester glycosidase family protein [Gaiellaceae bacterium]|jgi:hypothetical protein|nr:phosphodiester glycosidase family protein [Gaiellaceae bacterium]
MRLVLACGLCAALLVPLAAAQGPVPLTPGVTSERHVELTPHGPVAYTVITAPAPVGLTTIGPVLGGGTVTGPRQTMTQLEESVSGNAVAAGVNGDFFSGANAVPQGIVMAGGVVQHTPTPAHSSIGFDAAGGMHVGRISFTGTWQGTGQRRPIAGVNQQPRSGQAVLFTPAWGAATPNIANAAEVVLEPFPAAAIDTDLSATVASATSGATPIPADGAVLVATGSAAAKLQAEAPQGTQVTVRLILPDAWASVVSAIGGGPLLVKGGKAVFATGEHFDEADLTTREARAAVGQLPDGHVILVAVEGGRPGYSVGMTTYELARTMAGLGAVTAAGLQYGRFVEAAFDGQPLTRPSQGSNQVPVKEALLVQYAGVYAPAPSPAFVGKANAAAGVQLSYRLTRPSSVTATLIGPDGSSHPVDSGSRQPGTYHFAFSALDAEGTWHWNVQAVDDQNRSSTADQTFVFDETLTGLAVPRSAAVGAGIHASFTLSRPASVVLAIEAANGTRVAALPGTQLAAGAQSLAWDGTMAGGAKAPPGSYLAVVTETSSVGTASYTASFSLHR